MKGPGRDLRGASWVTSGTLLGQGVVFLLTPWIAFIYGPTALGAASMLLAAASILTPVLTMRMEFLIPTASEDEVRWINRRSLRMVVAGSTLAAIVFAVFLRPFDLWIILSFWVTCFSIAAAAISIQLLVRKHRYRRLGVAKAANGALQVGVQIPIGLTAPSAKGLEIGYAIGYLVTWGIQSRGTLRAGPVDIPSGRRQALMRSTAKLAVAGIMNAFCVWAILLALGVFHSAEDAGMFAALQRLLITPAGLLTAGLLPVVTGGVAQAIRDAESPRPILKRWLKLLAPVSIGAGLIVLLIPEEILVSILGQEYEGVGEFMDALAPLVATQILAGPLGQVLVAIGATGKQLMWDTLRFILIVAAALILGLSGASAATLTWVLSGIFAASYLVFVVLAFHESGGSRAAGPVERLEP